MLVVYGRSIPCIRCSTVGAIVTHKPVYSLVPARWSSAKEAFVETPVQSNCVPNFHPVRFYHFGSTLVFEKVAKRDYCGALDNLETCGAVYERYPGMCRFTMG